VGRPRSSRARAGAGPDRKNLAAGERAEAQPQAAEEAARAAADLTAIRAAQAGVVELEELLEEARGAVRAVRASLREAEAGLRELIAGQHALDFEAGELQSPHERFEAFGAPLLELDGLEAELR